MNYRNKNALNAVLSFIGFTFAFYFFFYNLKLRLLLAIIISLFITISIFFNPSKIEKLKKEQERNNNLKDELSSKGITQEDVDNLDLNNIEGFDDKK